MQHKKIGDKIYKFESMKFRRSLVLFIVTVSAIAYACASNIKQEQPNLLFIFPDQFRAHSMGFLNQDPVLTPNIDKLAQTGIVFRNAVSNRPLCSPYRAMLMTGNYSFSNGIQTNCNTSANKNGNYLEKETETFPDILKRNGYLCGYIGKWHLDAPEGPDVDDWREAIWEAYTPKDSRHGFDFWHAYGCNNRHLDPYYWVNEANEKDTLFPKKWSPIHEADVAIEFLKNTDGKQRDENKPWALFLSINPPHGPYHEVPEKYKDIYKNVSIDSLMNRPNVPAGENGNAGRKAVRDYFACVTGVDEQIGRILSALESEGLDENTIVVFTSDHGEMMGSHGLMQKVVHYEESFRVPFIMRWAGKLKEGENDLHLSVPDVMPSLFGLMNLDEAIPNDIEGINYSKYIKGETMDVPDFSMYMDCNFNEPKGKRGIRTDRYTFVLERNSKGDTISKILHDNKLDPFQLKNIAEENLDLLEEFQNKLSSKLKEINDPWLQD